MARALRALLCVVILLTGVRPSQAQTFSQDPAVGDPATGEVYHVEVSGDFWFPTPNITVSSEGLGIPGSKISAVEDLGVEKKRFPEFKVVLRPGTKHRWRIQYTPVRYEAEAVLARSIVFNGIRYDIGVPVTSSFQWNAWRFGYEYDFVYRDRGFVGFIVEAKYTDVRVDLDSIVSREFTHARAPVPAIGGIGRVYVAPNISVTFEATGFYLPDSVDENYRAQFLDFDLYGTLNFTNHVGVQFGYRSIDVLYRFDLDEGDLKMQGTYFGGVVRF
jgi:hypothetical protein